MVWKKKFSTIFQLSLSVLDNLHFEKIFHFQSSYLVHTWKLMKPLLTGKKSYHHFGLD